MTTQELVSPHQAIPIGASRPFRPYTHQTMAWDAMDRHYGRDAKSAGLVVVPTGGGKTVIGARWLLKNHVARGGRVLWLAHRRSLLLQARAAFHRAADLASGLPGREVLNSTLVSGDDTTWSSVLETDDLVFSTIQSAATEGNISFLKTLAAQSPAGLFVVIDEAHHAASPSYQRLLAHLHEYGCRLLGLTATPVRMDDVDQQRLDATFRTIIYQVEKQQLINEGILSKPVPVTVETHVDFEQELTEADKAHFLRFGEIGPQVLEDIATHSGRNQLIVDYYQQHQSRYGKTIVFAINTAHAQTLAHEFREAGVEADYIAYTRPDSTAVMTAFRDGPTPRVLVNVEILTEGFDAPKTQTVFLARPTRSESLLQQMIGRALRGPRADGTELAYLVSFVDTWSQFQVLDTAYALKEVELPPIEDARSVTPLITLPVPLELILEAYRLVKSSVRGYLRNTWECLPERWYEWEEEYADDIQDRRVLVFHNQVEGFDAMLAAFGDPADIPENLTQMRALDILSQFFADCPDPLPRWTDLAMLLAAKRRGISVLSYTFCEREEFAPEKLARQFYERDAGPRTVEAELRQFFEENALCRAVYKNNLPSFVAEVDEAMQRLRTPVATPWPEPVEPTRLLRSDWPPGQPGYDLQKIMRAVAAQPAHFPHGVPDVGEIQFSRKPMAGMWGWFRYSDRHICIHLELDRPDVPLYVLEYLVYHEMLHADMPNAGHDREFRRRERRFCPSDEALADAKARGISPPVGVTDGWRVLGDRFFDTYHRIFTDGTDQRMEM